MSIQSAVGNLTEAVDALTARTNVPASTLTSKVADTQTEATATATNATTAEGHVTTLQGYKTDVDGYLSTVQSGVTYDSSEIGAVALVDKKAFPLTINDLFVYDTSNDSDGGAWRERTEHTSWYNEDKAAGKWLGIHASESEARNAYATLGTEQVTNGTFDTDISGWTVTGSGTATWTDGQLDLQNQLVVEQQPVTTGSGTFRLTWKQTLTRSSLRTRIRIRNSADTGDVGPFDYYYGSGEFSVEFSTTSGVTLQIHTEGGHSALIDNISLREITAQTTATGDYYQDSTNGYFYSLNASSGTTQIYRGARAEFPAVAVLVATDTGVVVYDADDSTLPMWADWRHFFVPVGGFPSYFYANQTKSIRGLNGYICHVGARNEPTNGGGLRKFNLIADTAEMISGSYGANRGYITQGLSRNHLGAYSASASVQLRPITSYYLPSSFCNALDMTVRENAPIDDTTGLPKPTVVVVHNSGATVVKESDTVASSSWTQQAWRVAFSSDGSQFVTDHNSSPYNVWWYDTETATNTKVYDYRSGYYPVIQIQPAYTDFAFTGEGELAVASGYLYNTDYGLWLAKEGETIAWGQHTDLIAKIDTHNTTGWMVPLTEVAVINGIDSDDITGTPIVSNIATSTTDFSQAPWTASATTTITNGNELTFGSLYAGVTYPLFPVNVHDMRNEFTGELEIELDITHVSGTNNDFAVFFADMHNNIVMFNLTANTRQTVTLKQYPRHRIRGEGWSLHTRTQGTNWPTVIVHSITITRRPFIQNSLLSVATDTPYYVEGTITREPVKTGAELVACSGFNTTNYIKQEYNSNLDYGTGEFSIMGWVTKSAASDWVVDRIEGLEAATPTPSYGYSVWQNGDVLRFDTYENAASTSVTAATNLETGVWTMFVATREANGDLKMYLNGQLNATTTGGTVRNVDPGGGILPKLFIGARNRTANKAPWLNGKIAMIRIAGKAPSAEQVKFIYEAERELFQENAACTLYNDTIPNTTIDYGLTYTNLYYSTLPKRVAYDSHTGLLHTVTSAGRSSFKGLVRTDNSGTKWEYLNYTINTAVSASNGLIIEG